MSVAIDINRLSDLSRISFDQEEIIQMEKDMASILRLMDSIRDIEPALDGISPECASLDVLREDTVEKSLDPAVLISQCGGGRKDCFSIPRIIE